MAYKKFDDAPASADSAVRKLYKAFPDDAIRRALQSVLNRVVFGGQAGTATSTYASGLGTGGTCGVKLMPRTTFVSRTGRRDPGRGLNISFAGSMVVPTGLLWLVMKVRLLRRHGFRVSRMDTARWDTWSTTPRRVPTGGLAVVLPVRTMSYLETQRQRAEQLWGIMILCICPMTRLSNHGGVG
jgi:hypothetical protein